uniref:Uncharacterized protein n=1 Tax=Triticum urartu TaxID=4572 RepID=A0A8R7PHX4_TRIUA
RLRTWLGSLSQSAHNLSFTPLSSLISSLVRHWISPPRRLCARRRRAPSLLRRQNSPPPSSLIRPRLFLPLSIPGSLPLALLLLQMQMGERTDRRPPPATDEKEDKARAPQGTKHA